MGKKIKVNAHNVQTYHKHHSHSLADLGGRNRCAAPLRDPILLFWHTNFMKRSRLGSPRPPYEVHVPPTGNPGSATATDALYSIKVVNLNPKDQIMCTYFDIKHFE